MVDLFCAILRDEPVEWPPLDAAMAGSVFELARTHGVHLLLADRLSDGSRMEECPPALRERLVTAIHNQVVVDEIVREELRAVLKELGHSGIAPLVFKGQALAYSHYPDPLFRPRVDTDVLIDPAEQQSMFTVLERLHYHRSPFVAGDFVMHQAPYLRTDARGVQHAIDVHWKISNPQVFAAALTTAELRSGSVNIPALGPSARAVAPVHALAIACIHRVAHHNHEERLIWLYDIHLMAERLTAAEEEQFANLAGAKQLTKVCAAGLARAAELFGAGRAASLASRLVATGSVEPSQVYVSGKMRKVDVLASDLRALDGWHSRMKLVREHLFPPPRYMRDTYGVASPALLPLLYLWRVARGATRWWRR
jgi:hypothetical protein